MLARQAPKTADVPTLNMTLRELIPASCGCPWRFSDLRSLRPEHTTMAPPRDCQLRCAPQRRVDQRAAEPGRNGDGVVPVFLLQQDHGGARRAVGAETQDNLVWYRDDEVEGVEEFLEPDEAQNWSRSPQLSQEPMGEGFWTRGSTGGAAPTTGP